MGLPDQIWLEGEIACWRNHATDGLTAFYADMIATQVRILSVLERQKGEHSCYLAGIATAKAGREQPLLSVRLPPFVAGLLPEVAANMVATADRHAAFLTELAGVPLPHRSELLREVLSYLDFSNARYGLVVWRMPPEERRMAGEALEKFLGFATLAPIYASCAALLEENCDLFSWGETFCPVCGLAPTMAKLLPETGTRIAECWLCGTRWAISRLACPYCGNSDPERLEVLYLEADPAVRAHLCWDCHRYLKVVDVAAKGQEVVLAIENLASSRLDQIMQAMGYVLGDGAAVLPGMPRW